MKKRLIIGVIIGLIILALTIINELGRVEKIEKKESTETTSFTTTQTTTTSSEPTTKKTTKKVVKTTKKVVKSSGQVKSGTYKITHYGLDCKGCSGITASGYNVKNTIWYSDPQYGRIRVVATSKKFPLYSIIRLNNYGGGDFIAIVLDRGVSGNVIDVLVSSEKEATKLGVKRNVTIDLLRSGK